MGALSLWPHLFCQRSETYSSQINPYLIVDWIIATIKTPRQLKALRWTLTTFRRPVGISQAPEVQTPRSNGSQHVFAES